MKSVFCNSLINVTLTKLHFCSQRRMLVHTPNTSHSTCYSGFALFFFPNYQSNLLATSPAFLYTNTFS